MFLASIFMQQSQSDQILNNVHAIDSPSCTVGSQHENMDHFFLCCTQFNVIKCHLIGDIQMVMLIDIDHILLGNPDYDVESNKRVFQAVHQYIMDSQRFVQSFIHYYLLLTSDPSDTHLHTQVQLEVLYQIQCVGQLLNKYILNHVIHCMINIMNLL